MQTAHIFPDLWPLTTTPLVVIGHFFKLFSFLYYVARQRLIKYMLVTVLFVGKSKNDLKFIRKNMWLEKIHFRPIAKVDYNEGKPYHCKWFSLKTMNKLISLSCSCSWLLLSSACFILVGNCSYLNFMC